MYSVPSSPFTPPPFSTTAVVLHRSDPGGPWRAALLAVLVVLEGTLLVDVASQLPGDLEDGVLVVVERASVQGRESPDGKTGEGHWLAAIVKSAVICEAHSMDPGVLTHLSSKPSLILQKEVSTAI